MANENPYQSPASDAAADSVQSSTRGKVAVPLSADEEPWEVDITADTVKPRHMAAAIDYLLCPILAIVGAKQCSDETPWVQFAVATAIFGGYFFLFEALLARTPGKFMTGLIVIDMHGKRIGWWQSLVRNLWRFIEVNPLLLGALPAAVSIVFSRTHQRVGDRFAKTLVVLKRRL